MAPAQDRPRGRGPSSGRPERPVGGRTQRDRDRRVLGQNFLRDTATIRRIADAADLDPHGLVVEAGPGEGLLTRELARRAARVRTYELDARLAARLTADLGEAPDIEVVHADFLTAAPPDEPFQFVGAIPYGITSAIVDWCLTAPTLTSATLVTQQEFARKRTGDYGRWTALTVTTWPTFEWRYVAKVDRSLFTPVPRVHSAIMRLQRRPEPLVADPEARSRYADMVEIGFIGKGGSLYRSLAREWPRQKVDSAFARADVSHDEIVAFVHPDQWITLFRHLDGFRGRPRRATDDDRDRRSSSGRPGHRDGRGSTGAGRPDPAGGRGRRGSRPGRPGRPGRGSA